MTVPDQPQFAPATPKAASGIYIRLADILVAGGAILLLLFSWAPLVGLSGYGLSSSGLSGRSLWAWLSPLGLFVILATLLLLGTAIVDTWWHKEKPLVGLHRHHVQVALAAFVLVDIFGMSFADPLGGYIGISWGAFFEILFALVALAGALLNFFGQLQNPIGLPGVNLSTPKPATYAPAPPNYTAPTSTLPQPVDPTTPPAGS